MDDQEELERELNYVAPRHDRRLFKTNPPGYNILIGLGAILGLLGFGAGALITVSVLGKDGLSQIIACIVGLALGAFLGLALPSAFWRAIGPMGRMVLRPFGCLGAGPVIIAALLGFSLLAGGVRMIQSGVPLSQLATGGPLRGEDWQVLIETGKGLGQPKTMSLAEAQGACAALGKGWRLPVAADVDFIRERVGAYHWRRCRFHVEGSPKGHSEYFHYDREKGWELVWETNSTPRQVLCLRR